MASKGARRARKREHKIQARRDADYAQEPVIETLYTLLGIRNKVLAAPNVAAVLTGEQKTALGYPAQRR